MKASFVAASGCLRLAGETARLDSSAAPSSRSRLPTRLPRKELHFNVKELFPKSIKQLAFDPEFRKNEASATSLFQVVTDPEGPSTQQLRFLVPKKHPNTILRDC